MNKIISITDLPKLREQLKNKKIVLGTGCFDILHVGHIFFLQDAAKQGDVLVIGINSDRSIKLMKGSDRPIINETERSEIMAAFDCVDYVFIYDDTTAKDYILSLEPNVFATGEGSVKGYPDEIKAAKDVKAKLHVIKRISAPSTTSIVTKIQNINKTL